MNPSVIDHLVSSMMIGAIVKPTFMMMKTNTNGDKKMRTIKEHLAYKLFNNVSVREMAFLVMLFLIAYA